MKVARIKKLKRPETFETRRRRWSPSLDEIRTRVKKLGSAPLEEFLLSRADPNGLESVGELLPFVGMLSDQELLAKRLEIRRCQALLLRAREFIPSMEFGADVMALFQALDKAEARAAVRSANESLAG